MTRPADPQRLLAAHADATIYYARALAGHRPAHDYLHSRGITPAQHGPPWHLGYAPAGWTHLRDHLRGHGYTDTELLTAGLVTTARTGNRIDVFRDRVIFPIRRPDAAVIAFTGRDLSGHPTAPKWRNTAGTVLYRKSEVLYGLAEQHPLPDGKPVTVVLAEGPADVLALTRIPGLLAVAPCGTALTAEHITRLTDTIPDDTPLLVAFDSDQAGATAIDHAHPLLRDWPGPVDSVRLPDGTDPAALIAQHGPHHARRALDESSVPLVQVVADHQIDHHRLDEIEGRVAAAHSIADLLADTAERDPDAAGKLGQHIATRLGISSLELLDILYPGPEPLPAATSQSSDSPPEPAPVASQPDDGRQAKHSELLPPPETVENSYAHHSPASDLTATYVHHDPTTGHTAWAIAEGLGGDSVADRQAACIAAEITARTAVHIGPHHAILIARDALNTHYADRTGPQGNATILVVSGPDPVHPFSSRELVVAWAGTVQPDSLSRLQLPFASRTAARSALGDSSTINSTGTARGGIIAATKLHLTAGNGGGQDAVTHHKQRRPIGTPHRREKPERRRNRP